jgi:phosphohistidine phosphatase
MDLILWRHAEAEDGANDLARGLTPEGEKQAARVAQWLLHRLPSDFVLVASPALRAQQTAQALGVPAKTVREVAPGAAVSAILKAANWPDAGGSNYKGTVVLVGHQPDLGQAVAFLVGGAQGGVSIKKGGLWWLSNRNRDEGAQAVVRAVVSPDLL